MYTHNGQTMILIHSVVTLYQSIAQQSHCHTHHLILILIHSVFKLPVHSPAVPERPHLLPHPRSTQGCDDAGRNLVPPPRPPSSGVVCDGDEAAAASEQPPLPPPSPSALPPASSPSPSSLPKGDYIIITYCSRTVPLTSSLCAMILSHSASHAGVFSSLSLQRNSYREK